MSLETILKSIGGFFEKLFSKTVKDLDTIILPTALAVTNALKTITEADSADIIGHLAGAAGASLENELRTIVENVVPKLQLAQQFLSSSDDAAVILANIVQLLGNSIAVTKTAFYIEFSGMVAADLANGPLTLSEAVMLAQYFYKNEPQPTAAAIESVAKANS